VPGLREEIIAIICEEWSKGEDREIELNAANHIRPVAKGQRQRDRVRSPARAKSPRRAAPNHTSGGQT
jgi:hypothetical protein